MTEETDLLRAAIEASTRAMLLEKHDHAEVYQEKADEAWKAYDLCIWVQRYAE